MFFLQKMRRSRRNRIWHMAILFLVYSCLHVYSATIGPMSTEDTTYTPPDESTTVGLEEDFVDLTTATPHHRHHVHPTWRPRRENCTPPSLEQFPRPLMPPSWRRHGGLVIHVLVAIFTFLGLAIVCDDYFVSSLDRLCEGELL